MAVPKDISVRRPFAAGRFYPLDPHQCRDTAARLLSLSRGADAEPDVAGRGWGGIVPHAGWSCSGAIAGQTIDTLARLNAATPPDVIVVFGAVHSPLKIDRAALDSHGLWETPAGSAVADLGLTQSLQADDRWFVSDDRFHEKEHAVEVELPLIQVAWPKAQVMAIEVPLIESAAEIGRQTARRILASGKRAVFLASSDLTHYGPAYQFAPAGIGLQGLQWAKKNDRQLLDLVTAVRPDAIVPEVRRHANACGGGAIAAMLAACLEAGATRATLLRHVNSYEMLSGIAQDDPTNAVGYASVVVS